MQPYHYQSLAVIGNPISHSLSPLLHNTALRDLDLPFFYSALEVEPDKLGELCQKLKLFNYRGINVTVPYKVDIIPFMDELDSFAKQVGAVNTVLVQKDGSLKGYNTDGDGFLDSIRHAYGEEAAGKKVVFIGAGGAVRGVAFRLAAEKPESITIVNRSVEKADAIRDEMHEAGYSNVFSASMKDETLQDICNNADWIINGTSIGLKADDPDILPAACFREGQLAFDMIYNPAETKFLKTALEQRARPLNGLGMLVFQAAKSFNLWTGEKMPVDLVMQTLSKKF